MAEIITLNSDTPSIQTLCRKDKRLAKVISMVGAITYEPYVENPYAFLVHEIMEQMLSVKAGAKIYGRLEELCQGEVTPDRMLLLSEEALRSTGTSGRKAACIRSLTEKVADGSLIFNNFTQMPDAAVMQALTSLRGIGNWTAKMYLIFVLNRPDVLPFEDAAFLQGYGWAYKTTDFSPASVQAKCKKWKPYSSIAARYMYRALDLGLTKKEFHLFR